MRERPLCAFCLIFLLFQMFIIRGFQIGKDWKPSILEQTEKDGTVITISGKVYQKEVKKDNLVVYLTAKSYQTKIIVYIKQKNSTCDICIGNKIKVTGTVAYFDVPRNPGNFNQKFYYQKQGIHAALFATKVNVTNNSKNVWKEFLTQLRMKWKEMLIQTLGEEDGNAMSAILLGDKSELDQQLKELYQKNGIGHILAISGLHMTFIGIGFYQMLRKRGLSFVTAGLIGIAFLISYTMMIGSGVASMRALVMFIVRIGADMTGRVYDMLTSLALAAIVILAWRPLYLYDAGFLLSFGAILGVLLIYPLFAEKHQKEEGLCRKIRCKVRESIWGNISINLAILPCMLYFYFEFPPYSLLLNLFVIPLMSVVLGAGIIGIFVCEFVPVAGNVILQICRLVLFLYQACCNTCIKLPGSYVVLGRPSMWQIMIYYLFMFGLLMWFHFVKKAKENTNAGSAEKHLVLPRKRVMTGVVCIFAIIILCADWSHAVWVKPHTEITMLDVGQGDGLVVRSAQGLICTIDGGSSDINEIGKYRLEPYLKSRGIGSIDYAFISHGDMDHYSGIMEMLSRQNVGVKIKCLVLPVEEVFDEKLKVLAETAIENHTKVVSIHPGASVASGEMELTCLQPGSDYKEEIGNASSMVLSLSYGQFDMLFTGDVEGEGENILQNNIGKWMKENEIEYEILKVAHHGSKNSSNREFLGIVNPSISLISAGKNNRYGHPHQETLGRLQEVGSETLTTQENGAITIQTDGKSMKIRKYITQ